MKTHIIWIFSKMPRSLFLLFTFSTDLKNIENHPHGLLWTNTSSPGWYIQTERKSVVLSLEWNKTCPQPCFPLACINVTLYFPIDGIKFKFPFGFPELTVFLPFCRAPRVQVQTSPSIVWSGQGKRKPWNSSTVDLPHSVNCQTWCLPQITAAGYR